MPLDPDDLSLAPDDLSLAPDDDDAGLSPPEEEDEAAEVAGDFESWADDELAGEPESADDDDAELALPRLSVR